MQRGLTQEALAKLSGLARSSIAKIEAGDYPSQRTTTVEALAKALDVPSWWLISEDGLPMPDARKRRTEEAAASDTPDEKPKP